MHVMVLVLYCTSSTDPFASTARRVRSGQHNAEVMNVTKSVFNIGSGAGLLRVAAGMVFSGLLLIALIWGRGET